MEVARFSFGEPFPVDRCDTVFVGALIHWVFSCTASFGSFDRIADYLYERVGKMLLIEWIDPEDSAIKFFHHLDCGSRGDATTQARYNLPSFEASLKRHAVILGTHRTTVPTRVLYVTEKKMTRARKVASSRLIHAELPAFLPVS